MKKRLANKLHKLAVSGLSWEEYRRRVPREREKRAAKRWRRQFPVDSLARYWMPITRIIEENSLKNIKDIDSKYFLDVEYASGSADGTP